MASAMDSAPLGELLAIALPKDIPFTFYHISTPPTKCPAIFAAPPGSRPEKTYCESHFLNVSVIANSSEQLIFAIEVLVYTTKYLTTLFVSKADSTGYITELKLPKAQTSPLRSIATTFVSYIARHRQRPRIPLVVSLFARAANQYLYPGSVENGKKHVSDDRQLIKWWCRVLDPVLQGYGAKDQEKTEGQVTSQAYLVVPGEDGIAQFLPPAVRANPALRTRWKYGHPLKEISTVPNAPPRCLIPHFPDDPKARFLNELDDEIPDASASQQNSSSPSKRGRGDWKSVKTLEQFWDMMAFRQECSSGRMVGFIWVVMMPPDVTPSSNAIDAIIPTSNDSSSSLALQLDTVSGPNKLKQPKPPRQRQKRPQSGRIISRLPQIKARAAGASKIVSEKSEYYLWPADSRGEILLDEREYKRATELLLRLDFANEVIASSSTRRWIEEVGLLGLISSGNWGVHVIGRMQEIAINDGGTEQNRPNVLMVKSKRKVETETSTITSQDGGPNVLSGGLVRKKAKVETVAPVSGNGSDVNILNAGLVRKKAKT